MGYLIAMEINRYKISHNLCNHWPIRTYSIFFLPLEIILFFCLRYYFLIAILDLFLPYPFFFLFCQFSILILWEMSVWWSQHTEGGHTCLAYWIAVEGCVHGMCQPYSYGQEDGTSAETQVKKSGRKKTQSLTHLGGSCSVAKPRGSCPSGLQDRCVPWDARGFVWP